MVIIIIVTILYQSPFVEPKPSAHSQPPVTDPPPHQWKENPFGCQTDLASTLALPLTSNVRVKSLQSCSTLCDPMDCRLLCPWDSPGENTGVGCHALLQGNLTDPGIKLSSLNVSCIGSRVLYHWCHLGSPH